MWCLFQSSGKRMYRWRETGEESILLSVKRQAGGDATSVENIMKQMIQSSSGIFCTVPGDTGSVQIVW